VSDPANGISLGNVAANILITDTVPVHNGQPYVKRIYEVTPSTQDSATLCLYYLQEDFNEYSAYATNFGWPDLANPNLNNLAISQVDNGDIFTPGHTVTVIPNSALNISYDNATEVWKVCFHVDSFSYFYAHTTNPLNAALGVTWKAFNAQRVNQTTHLQWTTAMEKNSHYFEVERSTSGTAFRSISDRIASKAYLGQSDQALDYEYIDAMPNEGHNYYRIRQVDLDGRESYSKVADIYFGSDYRVTIYPNPAQEVLHVDVWMTQATPATIQLIDASGRIVKSIRTDLSKGNNDVLLPINDLSNGVYLVKVFNGKGLHYSQTLRKNGN
jgi:hypothetical protein